MKDIFKIGLIAAIVVQLVFDTGFFTVLAVSVVLGLLRSLPKGKEYREEARQQQAILKEPEQERLKEEQEKKRHRPRRPILPHELRALQEKRRQQQARLKEPEQERLKRAQGERSYRPSRPILPHELRALPYKEYLQTPHWKRKREDKLRTVGRRCQMCSRSSGTIDVHHNTYDRLGEELDGDLLVLCRGCHSWHHEKRRFGR